MTEIRGEEYSIPFSVNKLFKLVKKRKGHV